MLTALKKIASQLQDSLDDKKKEKSKSKGALHTIFMSEKEIEEADEEDEIIEALEGAGLTEGSSVGFVLDEFHSGNLPDNKVFETSESIEDWDEIVNEVIDFLEELEEKDIILSLISAKDEQHIPGHFEVSVNSLKCLEEDRIPQTHEGALEALAHFGQSDRLDLKNQATMDAVYDVLKAATQDCYPLRIDFIKPAALSWSNHLGTYKPLASIRNYDENKNVGLISWEEY